MSNLKRIEELSKHLDDALHIAEEFLNQTPYLYMAVDKNTGRIGYLMGDWERVLGWKHHEMLKNPFTDFLHPDDVNNSLKVTIKMNQGGFFDSFNIEAIMCEKDGTLCPKKTTVFTNRYRYKCKDGHYRYMHWQSQKTDTYEDYLLGIALPGEDYIEEQQT